MHTVKHGEWREDEGDQQGFPSREEGPKLIWFESPRWRPKDNSSSSPPYLGVQEQHAQKMTPRSHTESVLDVLFIDGKIYSRSFQWHRSPNVTSRICQGATPPFFGLLSLVPCRAKWPKWWTPPWPPSATLGRPLGYKLSSRRLG